MATTYTTFGLLTQLSTCDNLHQVNCTSNQSTVVLSSDMWHSVWRKLHISQNNCEVSLLMCDNLHEGNCTTLRALWFCPRDVWHSVWRKLHNSEDGLCSCLVISDNLGETRTKGIAQISEHLEARTTQLPELFEFLRNSQNTVRYYTTLKTLWGSTQLSEHFEELHNAQNALHLCPMITQPWEHFGELHNPENALRNYTALGTL